ncbi:hypothetical protein [Vibrio parahaemolyticus]|uniref:hypothetical protein n=1 Tax=Vibrio parahaemolyticus TaxID=670 RepID=UPI0021D0E208
MSELFNETRRAVVECWSNKKSSTLMNMLQIALVILFAVLALPAIPLLKNRVDFAASVFLGAFIWVVIVKLAQPLFV